MKVENLDRHEAYRCFIDWFTQLNDKSRVTIDCKLYKPRRTLSQNNFEHLLYDFIGKKSYMSPALIKAGIKVIINYTSVPVKTPSGVRIETTDPIEKLLHTLYYLSHTGYAEYK